MKAPPDWLLIILCVIALAGLLTSIWIIATTLIKSLVAFLSLIFYALSATG